MVQLAPEYDAYPAPNPNYDPGKGQERTLLDILAHEHRANPLLIRTRTGWTGNRVNELLKALLAAHWVVRTKAYDPDQDAFVEVAGLYQYNAGGVYSPRPLTETLPTPSGGVYSPTPDTSHGDAE